MIRPTLLPNAYVWANAIKTDFREKLEVSELKSVTNSCLSEYMDIYEYQGSTSFVRPLSYVTQIHTLAWPTLVQLVVSFNSGLQWGISQGYSFFVSSQWPIWFWVRMPLCEPNFLCIFILRIISGPRVTFVQWKAFNPPVVYTPDRSKAVVPMLFSFCVAL